MIFSAFGSAKNNKQTYAGAYMEHRKTGSTSNSNHQQYTFKKVNNSQYNNGDPGSKANRRHGSKGGGPMQLDPNPNFL